MTQAVQTMYAQLKARLDRVVPDSSPFHVGTDSMYYLFGAVVLTYVAKGMLDRL